MMKAALINEYGGEDVMTVVSDIAQPTANAGHVVVAVHASSANPFDWKVREGMMKDFITLEMPAILGGDVAGVVAEIGENVTGFEVGQEVYGMANSAGGHGAFAEFTSVSAKQLVPKPSSVDFVTAAAIPLTGVSAYQALVDSMNLQSGQKILIHGGAGGIGSFAIQLAKHIGAYVATTALAADADYVKGLGADEVIDYTSQDFSTILQDYDAVFDLVGGESNTKSYGILKSGGAMVSMVMPADEALVAEHGVVYTKQNSKSTVERLTAIATLVDQGHLKVNVDKVFTLDEAPEALEYLKVGHPRGKVVIQVV